MRKEQGLPSCYETSFGVRLFGRFFSLGSETRSGMLWHQVGPGLCRLGVQPLRVCPAGW